MKNNPRKINESDIVLVSHSGKNLGIVEKSLVKKVGDIECSVCNCFFPKKDAFPLFINYGGLIQERKYCSDTCRNVVMSLCGAGRAAIDRKDIKIAKLF